MTRIFIDFGRRAAPDRAFADVFLAWARTSLQQQKRDMERQMVRPELMTASETELRRIAAENERPSAVPDAPWRVA